MSSALVCPKRRTSTVNGGEVPLFPGVDESVVCDLRCPHLFSALFFRSSPESVIVTCYWL